MVGGGGRGRQGGGVGSEMRTASLPSYSSVAAQPKFEMFQKINGEKTPSFFLVVEFAAVL